MELSSEEPISIIVGQNPRRNGHCVDFDGDPPQEDLQVSFTTSETGFDYFFNPAELSPEHILFDHGSFLESDSDEQWGRLCP